MKSLFDIILLLVVHLLIYKLIPTMHRFSVISQRLAGGKPPWALRAIVTRFGFARILLFESLKQGKVWGFLLGSGRRYPLLVAGSHVSIYVYEQGKKACM